MTPVVEPKATLAEYLANPECKLAGLEHVTEYFESRSSDNIPLYHCSLDPCCNEQGKARQIFKHLNSYCHRKAWLKQAHNLEFSTRSEIDDWFQNNQFEMSPVKTIFNERMWEDCKKARIRGKEDGIVNKVLGQVQKSPVKGNIQQKSMSSKPQEKNGLPQKKSSSNMHSKKSSQNIPLRSKVSSQNKPKETQVPQSDSQGSKSANGMVSDMPPTSIPTNISSTAHLEQYEEPVSPPVLTSIPTLPEPTVPVLQDVSNTNMINNSSKTMDVVESTHAAINIDLFPVHQQHQQHSIQQPTVRNPTTRTLSEQQQHINSRRAFQGLSPPQLEQQPMPQHQQQQEQEPLSLYNQQQLMSLQHQQHEQLQMPLQQQQQEQQPMSQYHQQHEQSPPPQHQEHSPPQQIQQRSRNKSGTMVFDKPVKSEVKQETCVKHEGPKDLLHPEIQPEVEITQTTLSAKEKEHPEKIYKDHFKFVSFGCLKIIKYVHQLLTLDFSYFFH